jgi:hypothetical protein
VYEVNFPANVETQIGYIRAIVDGEMVKPDFFIDLILPGETLLSLLTGNIPAPQKGNIQSSGMKSGNILVNLS